MKAAILLLSISTAAAAAVSSAPTGVPTSSQSLTFMMNSKNGELDIEDSMECIQHFLKAIANGTYKLELPHIDMVTDGDKIGETQQLFVKSGQSLTGCTMIWTVSGSKEDLPFLVLKKHESTAKGLLSDLLGLNQSSDEENGGSSPPPEESRHSPDESRKRRHSPSEESRHSPEESRKRRHSPSEESRHSPEESRKRRHSPSEESRHSPEESRKRRHSPSEESRHSPGESRHHHDTTSEESPQ